MPTTHDRIPVTKDPELAAALDEVRALVGPSVKTATLVRDLAIRGAKALAADHDERRAALARVAERSIGPEPGFDRELLGRIDKEAWRLGER